MEGILISIIIIFLISITKKISNHQKTLSYNDMQNENIPSRNDLTNEEEIIILLKEIAENQRKIKTAIIIITVIILVPIVISVTVFLLKITVIKEIIQNII